MTDRYQFLLEKEAVLETRLLAVRAEMHAILPLGFWGRVARAWRMFRSGF